MQSSQNLVSHHWQILHYLHEPAAAQQAEPIYVDDVITLTKLGLVRMGPDGAVELTEKGHILAGEAHEV